MEEILRDCPEIEFLSVTEINFKDWIASISNSFVHGFFSGKPKLFGLPPQFDDVESWQDMKEISTLNWKAPIADVPYVSRDSGPQLILQIS